MKNAIQNAMTKKMTRGWKGYSIKVLLFICACLLLDWYQEKKQVTIPFPPGAKSRSGRISEAAIRKVIPKT